MAARPFPLIIFDCDSTLTRIEGIDELARRRGMAEIVAGLTRAAMEGEVRMEEVFARRLELIRPDLSDLEWLGETYCHSLVADALQVVALLGSLGKQVHVVSGGCLQAVRVLASALGLSPDHVHAVEIHLDAGGAYKGFDRNSPLVRSGGKAEVCAELTRRHGPAVAIGDGKTDLEMRDAGAVFIGFGGVVERAAVRSGADHYVPGPGLSGVLPFVLTDQEHLLAGSARV